MTNPFPNASPDFIELNRDQFSTAKVKPHKYGAIKTEVDGIMFASKREATRYQELTILEKSGVIQSLSIQPKFELQAVFVDNMGKRQRAINYVADFAYMENGKSIIEDSKGFETAVFKIKKKMFLRRYPEHELRITK